MSPGGRSRRPAGSRKKTSRRKSGTAKSEGAPREDGPRPAEKEDEGGEVLEPEILDVVEIDEDSPGDEVEEWSSSRQADAAPAASGSGKALTKRDAPARYDPLTAYIQQARSFPELDLEEERDLARRVRDTGDPEAAQILVTSNLRLVVKLALMYRRALRNVMDLIQEGNIGLLEALKRFDPEQGVKFSTYASWWIKAYILKFLMDNARLVRVGTTNARRKLLYNLRKEQRKLQAQGIDPTPKLLAGALGVSEDDVVEVDRALSSPDLSVDAPLGEDSRATVAEILPAQEESVEDRVARAEIKSRVDAAVAEFRETAGERERAILDLRLAAEEPATLQELGDRFGVTREAMRQAETKLKAKLAVFLKERLGDEIVLEFDKPS